MVRAERCRHSELSPNLTMESMPSDESIGMNGMTTRRTWPLWKKVMLACAVFGTLAVIGAVVYLRYFYGKDAPPPFELSSIALLPIQSRRSVGRRPYGRRRLALIIVSVITIMMAGNAVADAAKVPKLGRPCSKVGATSTVGATQLRCALTGRKKRWTATSVASVTTNPASAASTAIVGSTATAGTPGAGLEGPYTVSPGSAAGYRVRELFVGGLAKVEAVGRTDAVTGSVTLARNGEALVAQNIAVTVDMTKLVSGETRRDGRMKTTGLETDKFPNATFSASAATSLPTDAISGKPVKATLSGKLTLHGVSRDVQIPIDVQLKDGTIEVVGRLGITMKDYGIEPPEIPDFVKADDDGAFEFKLVLKKG